MTYGEEVAAYLEDGYFAQGVALLGRMPGVNALQIQHFQGFLSGSYVPSEVEGRLQDLLRPYAGEAPPPSAAAAPEEDKGAVHMPNGNVKPKNVSGTFWGRLFGGREEVPGEIWQLYQRAVKLHKKRDNLHPRIMAAAVDGDEKQAYTLAAILMEELLPELDGVYDAARAWDEKGIMPGAVQRSEVVKDTVEKMGRIKYCTERISRVKGILKKGKHKRKKNLVHLTATDRLAYEKELVDLEVERQGLRDELGI